MGLGPQNYIDTSIIKLYLKYLPISDSILLKSVFFLILFSANINIEDFI